MDVGDLLGYRFSDLEAVRFHCSSSAHNRLVHFKTSDPDVRAAAWGGDSRFDGKSANRRKASHWAKGFQVLGGHSGYLPDMVGGGQPNATLTTLGLAGGEGP